MRNYIVLCQKEWREHVRNYRIIWLPLVFLLLGMMDPLTYYFMDDILKSVGNLPDGMQITMPDVGASDMIVSTAGQLQSIGMVIFIAIYCSAISGERKNGTATLLYVRPVSSRAIFLSKWTVAAMMTCVGVFCSVLASSYYAEVLYGGLDWQDVIVFYILYSVWMLVVITFTLAMSALTTTAIAATISLILFVIGSMADALIGTYWTYSPFKLPSYAVDIVRGAEVPDALWMTCMICIALILLSLVLGIYCTHKNRQQTTV